MANQNWYLVYTKNRQEDRAQENLQRQGYHTYFPKICVNKRVRGHWQKAMEPLFPSYLFVKLSVEEDNWSPIRSTYGVNHIIKIGGQPAQIPNQVFESIKIRAEQTQDQVEIDHSQVFTEGQEITIAVGPMKGLDAIFKCYKGQERALILVDLLGKISQIDIEQDSLLPLAV